MSTLVIKSHGKYVTRSARLDGRHRIAAVAAGHGGRKKLRRIGFRQSGGQRIAIERLAPGLAENRNPFQVALGRRPVQHLDKPFPSPRERLLSRARRQSLPIAARTQPPHDARQTVESLGQPDGQVARVAGKQLVAAIARQRHGHVLPRALGNVPGRQGRAIGKGLVVMPDQARQDLHRVRPDLKLLVDRAKSFGRRPGVARLVELPDGETDGESSHRLADQLRHQPDDDRRVDPARKERPQRHFALQTHLDRRGQQLAQLPGVVGGGTIVLGVEIGLPVGSHLQPVVAPQGHSGRAAAWRCRGRSSAGAARTDRSGTHRGPAGRSPGARPALAAGPSTRCRTAAGPARDDTPAAFFPTDRGPAAIAAAWHPTGPGRTCR